MEDGFAFNELHPLILNEEEKQGLIHRYKELLPILLRTTASIERFLDMSETMSTAPIPTNEAEADEQKQFEDGYEDCHRGLQIEIRRAMDCMKKLVK